jgi:hypothetical protein
MTGARLVMMGAMMGHVRADPPADGPMSGGKLRRKQQLLLCLSASLVVWSLLREGPSLTAKEEEEDVSKHDRDDDESCTGAVASNGKSVTSQRTAEECLDVLGRDGAWVRDWDYAAHHGQYPAPRVVPRGPFLKKTWGRFRPSREAPFPWETSWRWEDRNSLLPHSCQIDHEWNGEAMCALLTALRIDRTYFFGDSLADSQFESLLNKMGPSYVSNVTKQRGIPRTEATLSCSRNSSIPVLMVRESGGNAFPASPRTNMVLSDRSREFLSAPPAAGAGGGRLLAIFNIGAHYHSTEHYREDLQKLFGWVDGLLRPSDLVFFRTTVSGHENCVPRSPRTFNFTAGIRQPPLARYDDFALTAHHDWNLFDGYNQHTRSVLQQRSRSTRTTGQHQVAIRLLDVVNMTVLRRDGHAGGADCLHYVTPGPIDWWNHLLYTHLQKIREIERISPAAASC